MAYGNSSSELGLYNVHSCNVLYSRAKREHAQLEDGYQTWLAQREKRQRGFNTQLDRLAASLSTLKAADESASSSKKIKAVQASIAKLQAELDRMAQEDKESADSELLERYPHCTTCQRPAYRRVCPLLLSIYLATKPTTSQVLWHLIQSFVCS